jgi:hypothetical protein
VRARSFYAAPADARLLGAGYCQIDDLLDEGAVERFARQEEAEIAGAKHDLYPGAGLITRPEPPWVPRAPSLPGSVFGYRDLRGVDPLSFAVFGRHRRAADPVD